MLEKHISQVAQQQASTVALAGNFPEQPHPNPIGNLNALTLQSGNELEVPVGKRDIEKNTEEPISTEKESEQTPKAKEVVEEDKEKPYVPHSPYKPPILFPQRLAKAKIEEQFKKFVEHLKKLHISIPFTEDITEMPSYAKFLKEILTNKKIDDGGSVALGEEWNTSIQNKMAPKLKDPGSFSILCVIGDVIDKVLQV